MTQSDWPHYSSGPVTSPENYHYETFRPAPDSMYDESIFGSLSVYSEDAMVADPRSEKWGHIPLCSAVVWMKEEVRTIPVIPPAYRRYVRLEPSATHAALRAERDGMLACGDSSVNHMLEAGLWNEEEDRPFSDEEIAQLPGGLEACELAERYRFIININSQLKRMLELRAPAIILERLQERLLEGVQELFGQLASEADLPELVRARALQVRTNETLH